MQRIGGFKGTQAGQSVLGLTARCGERFLYFPDEISPDQCTKGCALLWRLVIFCGWAFQLLRGILDGKTERGASSERDSQTLGEWPLAQTNRGGGFQKPSKPQATQNI